MKAFTERDDTAIAQLNDDELQALAEQVQLQEEIEQLPGALGVSGSWLADGATCSQQGEPMVSGLP